MKLELLAMPIGLLFWIAGLGLFWLGHTRRRQTSQAIRTIGWFFVLPASFVLRGAFGEVSALFPALMAALSLTPPPRETRALLLVYSAVTITMWVSALGLIGADIYATGYETRFAGWVTAAILFAIYFQWRLLAWAGAFGMLTFAATGYPSANLWDALVDVPSVILALGLSFRLRSQT